MKNLIAGNWKMNGRVETSVSLAKNIIQNIEEEPELLEKNDFLVCPPFPYLSSVQGELTQAVCLGAQDCSPFEDGAYTGDVSAQMLKDMSCGYVILGHSERRQYYVESNLLIKQKAMVAHEAGLTTIICIGESDEQRQSGEHHAVVKEQLINSIPDTASAANTVIAYEPVWAIGSGNTAKIEDIEDMHGFIRKKIQEKISESDKVRLLYGGSVKPENAAEILAVEHVNGALIGGASLDADDFVAIAQP